MKKTALVLFILAHALAACVRNTDDVSSSAPSYPNASYPNASYPNDVVQADYAPKPSDASLTRSEVFPESKELLSLESFPLQFVLHLAGGLPTPCHQLRVMVNAPDAENKIFVDVYSVSSPDEICTQVIAPFDVNIPLGSFPTGRYSLWVNGEMVAEFQS